MTSATSTFEPWLIGAVVASFAAITLALVPASNARAVECGPVEIRNGSCDVTGETGNGEVIIEGSTTTPGTGGSGDGGGASSVDPFDPLADCIYVLNLRCLAAGPGRTTPIQPVTLADIAHFRPDPGIDSMQPNGWMIVGLDTNFYSTGGVQVHDGALLGQPASVRFTPIAWHWTYGDGSGASRSTPGSTWAAQGIPEFDPTPTSHSYATAGTYYIDLTIDFAAEYRFAGMPWLDIAGVLPVPANRLVATAGDAKTVLVERECTINPSGPGC